MFWKNREIQSGSLKLQKDLVSWNEKIILLTLYVNLYELNTRLCFKEPMLFLLSSRQVEESIDFAKIFHFLFFDGFTRFGMSRLRFYYFWKTSFCPAVRLPACSPDCLSVAELESEAQELMHRISWNFIFRVTLI